MAYVALTSLTCAHRQADLKWCRHSLTWNHTKWGRIAFSEESCFELSPEDKRRLDQF